MNKQKAARKLYKVAYRNARCVGNPDLRAIAAPIFAIQMPEIVEIWMKKISAAAMKSLDDRNAFSTNESPT